MAIDTKNIVFKGNADEAKKMGPPAPSNIQTAAAVPNSAAKPQINAAAVNPNDGANGTAIRQGLVNMGLDNAKIGWNGQTGMVTYGGKDYLKPSSVSDGTSYADDAAIRQAAANIYQDSGNPLQTLTDVFSNAGISNAVQFRGDGLISVGGKAIKPTMITSDGKALVTTDQAQQLLADYRKQTGLQSNQDIYNTYRDRYSGRIEDALSKITDRDEWSYRAENDPAYRAYRDAYTREGNRALQDAMGNMSAMTGGYASSASATAGLQAQNYYMQQLNDKIPELMANSYDRYLGEQQLNQAALNSLLGVSNDDYSKMYQANRDTIGDVNAANDANWQRDMDNKQWNDAHAQNMANLEQMNIQNKYLPQQLENALYQDSIDNKYYEDNAIADLAGKQLSNNSMEQANKDAAWNSELRKAQLQNYISPERGAALGLEPNADGSYVSPWNAEIGYWNSVQKPQLDYQSNLNMKEYAYQAATSAKYAKSGKSGSGSSSKTATKTAAKAGADNWINSVAGFDGKSTYGNYDATGANSAYVAADKLTDPDSLAFIRNNLTGAGLSPSEVNSYIKSARNNWAIATAAKEGRDATDSDVIEDIKSRYGW